MNTVGENIKRAREQKHLTQAELANLAGVKVGAVWRWEKGERNPDYNTLQIIAKAVSVSVADLIDPKHKIQKVSDLLLIPIVPKQYKLSAGTGNLYEDLDLSTCDLFPVFDKKLTALYSKDGLLSMYVEGDSMEPTIADGDIVIFNHDQTIIPGDIYVVSLDGRMLVKGIAGNGKNILLRSVNKNYRDIKIKEGSDFRVLGRVLKINTIRDAKPVI